MKNWDVIISLCEANRDVYEPRTSNGGSYARLLKRGVAFGSQFPDVPVTSHQQMNQRCELNAIDGHFAESLLKLAK